MTKRANIKGAMVGLAVAGLLCGSAGTGYAQPVESYAMMSSFLTGATVQAQPAPTATDKVNIQNNTYSPGSITVKQGTTVTWTNNDTVPHTVTADGGTGPKSGQFQKGQTYSYKFDQVGSFAYHCEVHPQMKASVVVTAAETKPQAQPPVTPPGNVPAPGAPPTGAPTEQPPTPTGGRGAGGPEAAGPVGPVAAGGGSTAERTSAGLAAGILSLLAAAVVFFARRRTLSGQ